MLDRWEVKGMLQMLSGFLTISYIFEILLSYVLD